MTKYIQFTLLSLIFSTIVSLPSGAQSNAVQKASKSVFVLTTYKEDGSLLATTHGVYFINGNEGISSFKPFIGAYKASIIDASGSKSDVETIIGANDIYDICRFKLNEGSGTPLPIAQGNASGTVWAVGYNTKKADIQPLTIKSSEQFLDKYNYYIFGEEINEDIEGCPILTDTGELIGLVQQSGTSYAIHSTDSRYYSDLNSSGLSSYDAVLQKTHIRINLPADHEQARLMLLTLDASTDSIYVVSTTNDYISLYPDDIDGYSTMATYEMLHHNLQRASEIMETAINGLKNKDEAYYEYARMIYNNVIYADTLSNVWTLDLAEENINKAISINNSQFYRHLLAQITFSKGDYNGALKLFEELCASDIASSEVYYEIAQCKNNLNATQDEVLEYVEKAVESCPTPLTKISAPYILARGMLLDEMEEYRKALIDYNLYDSLMLYRADAEFYYTRAKCEIKTRQYQQAINDFSHAIILAPQQVTYLAELAALQLRVGQYEQALQVCDLSFSITTEYPDIYIVQGLALHQLGREDEALEAWQKANNLGDERATTYIEKYGTK